MMALGELKVLLKVNDRAIAAIANLQVKLALLGHSMALHKVLEIVKAVTDSKAKLCSCTITMPALQAPLSSSGIYESVATLDIRERMKKAISDLPEMNLVLKIESTETSKVSQSGQRRGYEYRGGLIVSAWNEYHGVRMVWHQIPQLPAKANFITKRKQYTTGFVDSNRGRHWNRKRVK